eukprot:gene19568-26251_t
MLEITNEIGVDEAGLGCLFGDAVAAAVLMPTSYAENDQLVHMNKDSKKCSAKRRAQLADDIKKTALAYGLGCASAQEIDNVNILNGKYLAMHRALDAARDKMRFGAIAVNGNCFKPYGNVPHRCVVGGDNILLNIAAASIIAKDHRDKMIINLLTEHPEWKEMYGFHTNMGYGTKKHIEGLAKHGPTVMHRMSYAPVMRSTCVLD